MLDHDGDTHLYVQIADIIREQIRRGELPPGHPIPSEAAVQSEFGVARTTARRAFHLLREEGLIYTVQGEGTFVSSPDSAPRKPRTIPMYRKIADDVVDAIRGGDLLPRRPIPSETALVQKYEVARETARRAIALLRERGWVYTVPQRGSFVSPEDAWPRD
ncbi:GntR family transcriptional regulator [Microbispora sp. RL4-1S]|uniref:GntR family transcriptional regulator n=1 Tax=Microbispora oryzae TaxID=2806554 RepID=A0A940WJR6_9ACTN|nr:GntR family transcriptional regulator [Microbispora oryzae]MBP2702810.1 GntR family transcriptional regulator [Microbispora oryzae]